MIENLILHLEILTGATNAYTQTNLNLCVYQCHDKACLHHIISGPACTCVNLLDSRVCVATPPPCCVVAKRYVSSTPNARAGIGTPYFLVNFFGIKQVYSLQRATPSLRNPPADSKCCIFPAGALSSCPGEQCVTVPKMLNVTDTDTFSRY